MLTPNFPLSFSFFRCLSLQEVDSVFTLLSAVLHIGDLRFTALTDADTAFPVDLQLLEKGQSPRHNWGHISTPCGSGEGEGCIISSCLARHHSSSLSPSPGVLLGSNPALAKGQTVTCLVSYIFCQNVTLVRRERFYTLTFPLLGQCFLSVWLFHYATATCAPVTPDLF